jgi:hypothetical protein
VPGVEEEGLRQGCHPVGRGRDDLGIEAHRVADAFLVSERHGAAEDVVLVQSHDRHLGVLGAVEPGQQRGFLLAGLAPGGEEVHDERFAGVVAERDLLR